MASISTRARPAAMRKPGEALAQRRCVEAEVGRLVRVRAPGSAPRRGVMALQHGCEIVELSTRSLTASKDSCRAW
jgi:hypothetical protein